MNCLTIFISFLIFLTWSFSFILNGYAVNPTLKIFLIFNPVVSYVFISRIPISLLFISVMFVAPYESTTSFPFILLSFLSQITHQICSSVTCYHQMAIMIHPDGRIRYFLRLALIFLKIVVPAFLFMHIDDLLSVTLHFTPLF